MMEYTDEYFAPAYRGSKQYTQQEVKTANATGFGAAADDYMERGIDLNEQLIKNKPATFTSPWWSLRADFRMYRLTLLGRMGPEITRANQLFPARA